MNAHDPWLPHAMPKNALADPLYQYAGPSQASDSASILSGTGSTGYAESVPARVASSAPPSRRSTRSNGALKTVHSYTGANDTLFVQLHTPPQTSPTYMGGSKERESGAIHGRLILHCTDKSRVAQVRMKLKCVVSILAPRASQATSGTAPNFSGLTPSTASTSSREQMLVQIDYSFNPNEAKYCAAKGAAVSKNTTGRLDRRGYYEWEFHLDTPEKGPGKSTLANGFPGVGTYYPSSYVLESDPNKNGKREEWASVKWYLKFTLERPGLFRSNDRVLIPFIYLPPPPDNASSLLIRRQALSTQTQNLLSTMSGSAILRKSLSEPVSTWKTFYFTLSSASLGQPVKRSLVDKMFGTKKPREERWGISLPGKPIPAFPLRSIVPFVLTLVHSAGVPLVVHPAVSLIQTVQLRGRSNATHTKHIALAKVMPSSLNKSGMQQWFGWVQFPKWCSPSFETSLLGLEYFLQVKPLNTPEAHVLQTIALGLYCMPPRLAQQLNTASVNRQALQQVARRQISNASALRPDVPLRRVPPPLPPTATSIPVPVQDVQYDDPRQAGMAGIGRAHLQPPVPAESASDTDFQPTQTAHEIPHVEAESTGGQVDEAPVTEEESITSQILADHIADEDGLVHDAGPLTQEQEAAWTMDILANAMNEDDVTAGFDLPPSYFEATGIIDNEES